MGKTLRVMATPVVRRHRHLPRASRNQGSGSHKIVIRPNATALSIGVDPPLAHENYYNTDRGYSGSGALAHYERRQEFVEALIGRL